jgi:acyl-CoA thioesterase-1
MIKAYIFRPFALAVLLFFTSCSISPKPITGPVVCFGDSITFGTGAKSEEAYPNVLASLLKLEVINAGVAGDTTEAALARVENDVVAKRPGVVVIELGGNDFMRGVPLKTTLANLEAIIKAIKRSKARVFVCDIASKLALSGYSRPYEQLCKRTGATYIDGLLRGVLDDDSKKSDEIHPNAEGYSIIASRVAEALGG